MTTTWKRNGRHRRRCAAAESRQLRRTIHCRSLRRRHRDDKAALAHGRLPTR